jgi:hypothetical protein
MESLTLAEKVIDFVDNWAPAPQYCQVTVIEGDDGGHLCGQLTDRRCLGCRELFCNNHLETVAFERYCFWCARKEEAEIAVMVMASRGMGARA